jgi:hypothetical protein
MLTWWDQKGASVLSQKSADKRIGALKGRGFSRAEKPPRKQGL